MRLTSTIAAAALVLTSTLASATITAHTAGAVGTSKTIGNTETPGTSKTTGNTASPNASKKIEIPCLPTSYPRLIKPADCRQGIQDLLETEGGRKAMDGIVKKISPYADRHIDDPEWIVSRLQMYWQSHANEIYVKGEKLDHVAGRAPVPTVRFTATRGTQTEYRRPKLADIQPYQDSLGMLMHNKAKPGEPLEWADPRETGRNVESINVEILELARDAAFLYWWTSDEKYARFAADIFDTYMTGLYYREVPVDLNHGHQQTLLGLTSFEVIHENSSVPAAECYDFLHDYLAEHFSEKLSIYEDAFRKWADAIIGGGVPHNNWNLIQAQFSLRIALILSSNDSYPDGRGREWFLNEILNEDSTFQWSPGKLIDFGFDPETALWKESPGYSTMVLEEWGIFIRMLDTVLGIDLVETYPILAQAAQNAPEYLFPNGLICGWGDTHVGGLRTSYYPAFIENAIIHGKPEQEKLFTAMYRFFNPTAADSSQPKSLPAKTSTFTSARPPKIDDGVPAGTISDYTSPVFWSEGVSWFAARTGMDPQRSLMMSIAGSMGNHMHANGISMELYGRGFIQAPDAGRGSGYTTLDYAEYYSQFPAHNTVCVDGASSYAVMQSRHGFWLNGCYPEPQKKEGNYPGVMFGDFGFIEPETYSDQRRQVLIINTDPENGYYIDVFRSRRRDGKDKMHDYFYHNIGQSFELSVPTEPTTELTFAGAHLSAYSYLWNKSAAQTAEPVHGVFTMNWDEKQAGMNMWMKGSQDRKVFKALAPYIDGLSRTPMPYDITNSPCQTFIARQYGEAWDRPFVAVYEPFSSEFPSCVSTVEFYGEEGKPTGIAVTKTDGRKDVIISSDKMTPAECESLKAEATLVLGSCLDGEIEIFIHEGIYAEFEGLVFQSREAATAAVKISPDGTLSYISDKPCTVKAGKKKYRLNPKSEF